MVVVLLRLGMWLTMMVGVGERWGRLGLGAAILVACMLGSSQAASASRQPTFEQREAITAALPAWVRSYPVGCVWLHIEVSNGGSYALVGPVFLNALHPPCSKYASNGQWILKKTSRWRVIYNGSGPTTCSKVLRAVPRDLISGLCLARR